MNAEEYQAALIVLGLTPYSAARWLGISLRQSHRYASGEQIVSKPVVKLLDAYLVHGLPVANLPQTHAQA